MWIDNEWRVIVLLFPRKNENFLAITMAVVRTRRARRGMSGQRRNPSEFSSTKCQSFLTKLLPFMSWTLWLSVKVNVSRVAPVIRVHNLLQEPFLLLKKIIPLLLRWLWSRHWRHLFEFVIKTIKNNNNNMNICNGGSWQTTNDEWQEVTYACKGQVDGSVSLNTGRDVSTCCCIPWDTSRGRLKPTQENGYKSPTCLYSRTQPAEDTCWRAICPPPVVILLLATRARRCCTHHTASSPALVTWWGVSYFVMFLTIVTSVWV